MSFSGSEDKKNPTLSKKQYQFIMESTAKINIAHGAVRSGKTHASLLRFATEAIKCPDNAIYMIGNSFASIVDNGVKTVRDVLFPGYCTWQTGKQLLSIGNKQIQVIGANDESAVRRIQGGTHSLVYVDEMSTIPPNFLDMLYTRLSKPYSMLIGTTNPDSPMHPLKKLIDQQDGKYCYALHFALDDNPFLPEGYREMLERLYTGLFYKRYVLGQWVLAEGSIYDCFERKRHVLKRPPAYSKFYVAGIDVGSVHPFAMVLVGYNDGARPMIWVEKEFYWDPKQTGRQKTNAEFADDVERELEGYGVKKIYIDPSAENMQLELRKRKLPVCHAINDVQNGISSVATMLKDENLGICECCPNLIREIQTYAWDPKKAKAGLEEPIKLNDDACDALRYAIHSHFGNLISLRRKPVINSDKGLGYKAKNPYDKGTDWGHGWQTFGGI